MLTDDAARDVILNQVFSVQGRNISLVIVYWMTTCYICDDHVTFTVVDSVHNGQT